MGKTRKHRAYAELPWGWAVALWNEYRMDGYEADLQELPGLLSGAEAGPRGGLRILGLRQSELDHRLNDPLGDPDSQLRRAPRRSRVLSEALLPEERVDADSPVTPAVHSPEQATAIAALRQARSTGSEEDWNAYWEALKAFEAERGWLDPHLHRARPPVTEGADPWAEEEAHRMRPG